jgi:hypothetical protein
VIPDPRAARRLRVSAQCGADSRRFVGDNAGAGSRPAEEDALLAFAAGYGFRDLPADERPVRCCLRGDRRLAQSAKEHRFVTVVSQPGNHCIGEMRSFVAANGESHRSRSPRELEHERLDLLTAPLRNLHE